ncbi:hypothetical protein GCM10022214_38470 [Actinomadura miaoliensis]|uniref:Uncharacterized protein n=1 Tax=Actinomadura miaoliensis TaxID=430685 RepID=A0ABP7VZ15_9ACTN
MTNPTAPDTGAGVGSPKTAISPGSSPDASPLPEPAQVIPRTAEQSHDDRHCSFPRRPAPSGSVIASDRDQVLFHMQRR